MDALSATGSRETCEGSARPDRERGRDALGPAAGGFIAQQTSLAPPFVLRGVVLIATFAVASGSCTTSASPPTRVGAGGRDAQDRLRLDRVRAEVPAVNGPTIRPCSPAGWGFYGSTRCSRTAGADGDPEAYQIAGLVAAIVPASQILGAPPLPYRGLRRDLGPVCHRPARRAPVGLIGIVDSFWAVIALIAVWGLAFAASMPIRQAYINGMIPSRQCATILSFDSLMTSVGGVWAQPVLGRSADVWGYAPSYLMSAGIMVLALPFLALSRRQNDPADAGKGELSEAQPAAEPARPHTSAVLRLVTIPISHYCEKARWALDRAGMPYREERHVQGIHRLAARRAGGGTTVPVLVTPDAVLGESGADPRLGRSADALGAAPVRAEPSARYEVERLCRRFDEDLGPRGRRLVYVHMLAQRELALPYNTPVCPPGRTTRSAAAGRSRPASSGRSGHSSGIESRTRTPSGASSTSSPPAVRRPPAPVRRSLRRGRPDVCGARRRVGCDCSTASRCRSPTSWRPRRRRCPPGARTPCRALRARAVRR